MKHLIILTCLICSMSAGAQVKKDTSRNYTIKMSPYYSSTYIGSGLSRWSGGPKNISLYDNGENVGYSDSLSKWHFKDTIRSFNVVYKTYELVEKRTQNYEALHDAALLIIYAYENKGKGLSTAVSNYNALYKKIYPAVSGRAKK